jgi:hypothetical protein
MLSVRGQNVLGLGEGADPQALATAVDRWLRKLKREGLEPTQSDCTAVAIAYGHAVARVTGWRWAAYSWQDRSEFALASTDASYVHLPVAFILRQISKTETTALLLFNMLASGQRPDARPGDLAVVG